MTIPSTFLNQTFLSFIELIFSHTTAYICRNDGENVYSSVCRLVRGADGQIDKDSEYRPGLVKLIIVILVGAEFRF